MRVPLLMRSQLSFFIFLALLACIPLTCQSQSKTPALHGAYRFQRAHWIYVHLDGTPHQIGFEHGYLLAPEIEDALTAVRLDNTHRTGRKWQFFRSTGQNVYWPHIETQYREELQGITDGLKAHGVHDIDLWDVVALNGVLETPEYYLPWLKSRNTEGRGQPEGSGQLQRLRRHRRLDQRS